MNRIKSIIISTAVGTSAVLIGLSGQAQAAGNASLSMSGGAHVAGSSFVVPIYVNSADPVNVVQADFSYDASQLRFQGVSCGGSFGIAAGAGANSVTCGVSGGSAVTGSQLVAIINFRALAGSGSSMVSIAPSSHVYSATDNSDIWNGATSAAGISFTTPVPVAAAPVTPAPVQAAKTPVKHVSKQNTIVTKSTNKHLSAWIYGPVAIIASAAGLAYVFRREIKPLTKKLRKNYRVFNKRLQKNSLVKSLQRS